MGNPQQKVRVAVVQAASVIMDKELSTDKAISLTLQAGEQGVNIVVFPEAFIPLIQGDSVSGPQSEAVPQKGEKTGFAIGRIQFQYQVKQPNA